MPVCPLCKVSHGGPGEVCAPCAPSLRRVKWVKVQGGEDLPACPTCNRTMSRLLSPSSFEALWSCIPCNYVFTNDGEILTYHGTRSAHFPPTAEPESKTEVPARPVEADPTGRDPHAPGAKLDAGKPAVLRGCLQYFPNALKAVSVVSAHGAAKYTWSGWRSVPDGPARYGDALVRHLLAEATEDDDKDSGLLHAAHAAWNALARLELILVERSEREKSQKA